MENYGWDICYNDTQLAADIFAAGAASDTALFAHAEALKADPDADIYAGWPAVFEG
jgi:hypothetical protein